MARSHLPLSLKSKNTSRSFLFLLLISRFFSSFSSLNSTKPTVLPVCHVLEIPALPLALFLMFISPFVSTITNKTKQQYHTYTWCPQHQQPSASSAPFMPGVAERAEESLKMLQLEEVGAVVAARRSLRRVSSRLDARVVSVALYCLNVVEDFEGRWE